MIDTDRASMVASFDRLGLTDMLAEVHAIHLRDHRSAVANGDTAPVSGVRYTNFRFQEWFRTTLGKFLGFFATARECFRDRWVGGEW